MTMTPSDAPTMAARVRSLDWSRTPLGPREGWPQSLRTASGICLESSFPMAMWWGPDLIQLYNDGYATILGAKHPRALGQRGDECWAEIWSVVGPLCERVRRSGQTVWMKDLLLEMSRHGFLEETYFTFSYSPIREESGAVGGVLNICTETTERVIGERRLGLLRDLGARASGVTDVAETARQAAQSLAGAAADLPFALIYLLDETGAHARLAGRAGFAEDSALAPTRIALADPDAPWPLARVVAERAGVTVEGLPDGLPRGPWTTSPHTAVALPLRASGGDHVVGVLVAGVSPRLALDDVYRGFLGLVAGHVAGAIAAASAFEEERARARALAELDRAKTDFFSNVSHELRTPITLQLGPLEDALSDTREALSPAQRERVELAHRNSLRLLRLVNTLLDFARVEAGRTEVTFEETDLAHLTRDLASNFRTAAERAGIELDVRCEPLPRPVSVDREMWEKVVLNLLSNALKFTFEGRIEVGLRADGDDVELRVSDTGVGMSPEERANLFQRFHRVRGQRSRTHEGTGIGLALVKEVVRLHGGRVSVESEPGVGTTFRVRVPFGGGGRALLRTPAADEARTRRVFADESERWIADAPAPADAPPSPDRVLVVDDNADMRAYLTRLLSDRWRVEALPDGRAALEAALRSPPRLVLSDVMMPGLDGHALVRALRSDPRTRDVPVLLLSARAGEESRLDGLDAGADDYVEKPFSARELVARVSAHIALAETRRAAAVQERCLRAEVERERGVLREIFDSAPAMMALLRGPSHVFEMANEPYCASVSKDAADVLGRSLAEVLPEVADQGYVDILDRVFANGEPFYGAESPVRVQPGAPPRYFTFAFLPLRDATGAVDRILVHAVDVTETVGARARAEEKEHQLRLVTDALPALVSYIDRDLRYVFVNETYRAWFGLDPASIVGQSPENVVGPEVMRRVRAAMERALAGETSSVESGLETAPPRKIRSTYVPDLGADGVARGVVALVTDVTEQRDREERLRESEERYRLVTCATREAVWDWDLDRGVLIWGEGLRELFGHAPEDTPTTLEWWVDRIHPEDRERVTAGIDAAVRGSHPRWTAEYRFARKDGSWACVTDRGYIQRGPDGRAHRVVGTLADVTDLRRAEERIAHAQRMEVAGNLAGGVAHEVNNMMTVVIGLGEMAARRLPLRDRTHGDLTEMIKAGRRAAGITHQLLAYSGRQVLQPSRLDLVAAMDAVEPLVARIAGGGVRVERGPRPAHLWVDADRAHLDQAIVNLALNAADAMPGGGTLTLSLDRVHLDEAFVGGDPHGALSPGDYARIDVVDTGAGMDELTLRRAFEPFFTTKPIGSGTGLGLSSVYGMVRQSGGTVRLESAPGAGTRVSLYFPERPAPAVPADVPGPAPSARRERVLVVEDEALVRKVARLVLEDAGFDVVEAADGQAALAAIDRVEHVDIVLSDVVMPVMGGRDLGRALARRGFRGPILYMSGYTGDHLTQHDMLDAGAPVLLKPFTAEELVRELRRALAALRVS